MNRTSVDYRLLANFAAVAEQRSFTKAARRLGLAKGTVSRGIAELERQLSTELLHRTTQRVALSTAGEALYDRIQPHLRGLDEAMAESPDAAATPSGRLRITAPPDFGGAVLPEVLATFARRFAEISFDVRLTNEQVDLVAEGYDLGIRASAALKDSTLKARRLSTVELGCFASPTYVARCGRPTTFADPEWDWILHTAVRGMKKKSRRKAGADPRFVCDDFFAIRDLACAGAGIGMMPSFVATPLVRDGLLQEISLREPPALTGRLFLVYPSRGQVPSKVVAFRDFLLKWLERAPLR
ncbi:MAG: LysR family transcriptional regulator [Myxococcota bacterium]